MAQEIFDDYCWQKHKQIITSDRHHVPGLNNFTHWNINESSDPIPLHYHSDIVEIFCMLKGKKQVYLENNKVTHSYTITGNEAFITYPYEVHSSGGHPQGPCEYYALQINISNKDCILGLDKKYSHSIVDILLSLEHRHVKMSSTQLSLLRTGFNLFSSQNPLDVQSGVQFITCFLYNLQYILAISEEKIVPIDRTIQKAVDYIEKNYQQNISLEELSRISGYSLSHFKSKFKEEIGITPAEFINLCKIEHAKNILETSDTKITELAYDLGFSSSNYFCSVFKKLSSCSPREYRYRKEKEAESLVV